MKTQSEDGLRRVFWWIAFAAVLELILILRVIT